MKKTLLLSIFIFLAVAEVSGQYYTNQNKVWVFGTNAGVNFSTGSPVPFSATINTLEGCASVSNAAGSLLFYTDGKNVYNKFGAIMTHGTSIVTFGTTSTTQAALIVPMPGNANQYYLFSLEQASGGHLAYSIVDMTLSGGLGDLVTGAIGIGLATSLCEKMTAVAGNSCDVWLLVHSSTATQFLAYDITEAGIGSPVTSTVGTLAAGYSLGVIKASPNRLKIMGEYYPYGGSGEGTELYDFDPTTGIVSNCQVLNSTIQQYGGEFSPDNTKLYAQQYPSVISQYDISLSTTSAIIASMTTVATGSFGDLKLAPDGKIYIVDEDIGYLDCISTPNIAGTGCGYTSHAVTLVSGTHCILGLPNIVISIAPNDTFYTFHDTSVCIPGGGSITITAHDTGTGSGYLWDDGVTTTRTRGISAYGIYRVGIYNGCGLTMDTIHVMPLSADTLTGATTLCAGTTTTLSATLTGGSWSSASTGIATVGSSSGIVTGVSGGTAAISYIASSGCPAGITVTVKPTPATITGVLSICAGATTALSNSISGGTWSSSNTTVATVNSVSGFVTSGAAGNATITYNLGDGCSPATAIVTVNSLPSAITGVPHVCTGASTALSDSTGGGAWSPVSGGIATVGITGLVSGIATGAATISYTLASGCGAAIVVTVTPLPSYIYGASSLCAGATATLSDGISGGTWSSSNTTVATVGSISGMVTGSGPGTVFMTYTLPTGCAAAITLAVYALPLPVTGSATVCTGATIIMNDASADGTWSSSAFAIATIDIAGGVVTGLYGGTATISYTTGPGCASTKIITVNALPSVVVASSSSVCVGAITFLGDATTGGTWSSNNTTVATIDSVTGTVTGVAAGAAVMSYTIGTGCSATDTITVNISPRTITGSTGICVGLTTTLSDSTTGGTWSSDNTSVATAGSPTGIVTGVAAGTAGITYTMPSGCFANTTVTVNTSPGAITGVPHICAGSTTLLSDPAGGGTWSSSNTTVAAIGLISGVVSGLIPGPTTITYSLGAGCSITALVTVNPLPTAITGTATTCVGATTTLIDGGGGTWSSGNTAIATTGAAPGTVTGAMPGTVVITYSLPTGCTTTKTVTVNSLPSLIDGPLAVCSGSSITLSDPTSGGTWSSSASAIASINSTSGAVTAGAAGTALITYKLSVTGCAATATVTVNPLPAAIGGSVPFCAGATITLNDITGGGTWSPTVGATATVGPTGIVSGVSSGTAIITYTIGTGCKRTATVTVDPLPTAISGPAAVCVSATIPETDIGGSWSGGSPSIATIGSGGVVTGVALGSTSITYTLPTGCAVTKVVSVSLSPVSISGAATVCAGDTTTLSDAVSGGAWSSSNTSAAVIGSPSGTVTGAAPGITVITYSLGSGCTVTKLITVNTAPAAISGPGGVCIGSTITLGDVTTGGVWSPAVGSIATVNASGVVSGISAGTAAISYTAGGCAATATVTVNPAPTAIGGVSKVCAGDTITLIESVGGGTWSSSHTAVATVGITGTVFGTGTGVTTITYSLGAGCIALKTITVNPISPITGATGVCVGAITTLSDSATGGAWTSPTGAGIATVNAATGIVSGLGAGTAGITYTTVAGCTATTTVTVNLAPTVISGNLHVCAGDTTTLSDAAAGGTWTSGNTLVATVVFSTGVVTGVSPGTSIVVYSLGSSCTVNAIVTVNPLPSAITGTAKVCSGSTTNLYDVTTGGAWGPSSGSIATVNATGMVTGVSAGIATITYSPGSGCSAMKTITVNPTPASISGITNVCVGLTTTLTDTTTGGTWSLASGSIATVNVSGTVTAVSAGTASITYALPTGCAATTSIIVNSAPGAIFGTMKMCIGSTTTLSDPTSGGTWSPVTGSIATVNAAGVVSGVSLGTAAISYTVGGCPATTIVTVNSLPGTPAAASVCIGSAIILTDSPAGGTWSSPTGAGIVMVDATTGAVTGEGAGTAEIIYSLGAGCTASTTVTVNPLPAAPVVAGGVDNICKGYTTIVTDPAGSGTWSCAPAAVATITGTGIVTGAGGGMAIISYTVGTGCSATTTVFVTEVPPITGATHLCAYGDTVNVYDAMPGGTWSSTLATVSSDGLVTGYGAGLATVTYTVVSGCFATTALTVNPVPGPIMGTGNLCVGTTTTLSDTATSGAWSLAAGGFATVSSEGIVTGVSAGIAVISYSLPVTGCMRILTVTVDPYPSIINGSTNVCVGNAITLSDTVTGGIWSSASAIATAGSTTGIVTAVSAGTATITYSLAPGCTATKTITVNPLPHVYTVTGGGNYCAGTGGVDIGLSGADAGISYSLYHGVTLAATITGTTDFGLETLAGTYKVVATNSTTSCITEMPDSVTVTIMPSVTPSVTIAVSPANTVCAGTPVTFTATPVNGGIPTYQWAVNSTIVAGVSGATYSYAPADNDVVKTTLTSSATCAIPATVSDSVTMTVVTPVIPTVTINVTPGTNVKPGESVTFTAAVTGGVSLTYQWEIDGNPVAGATTATFTNTFNGIDTVSCIVSGGGICNPEGSNEVVIVASNVGVATTPGRSEGEVTVLPNPNNGTFIITGSLGTTGDEDVSLEITDMLGQVVYRDRVVAKGGMLDERISLNNTLANGMYLLNVKSESGNSAFHIVIGR